MRALVWIGYKRFVFKVFNEAVEFATTARKTCVEEEEDIKMEFILEEGSDEV